MQSALLLLSWGLKALCCRYRSERIRKIIWAYRCVPMQALTDAVATYGPGIASLAGTPFMYPLLLLDFWLSRRTSVWEPIPLCPSCRCLSVQAAMTLVK